MKDLILNPLMEKFVDAITKLEKQGVPSNYSIEIVTL